MYARRGPALVPVQQIGVLLVDTLKTLTLKCSLNVADRRFDFAFEIGSVRPARYCHAAVVSECRCVELVDLRVVDIGIDHALFEIIRPNDPSRAAKVREALFMEFRPNLRRRFPKRFGKHVTTHPQRHDEEPRLTILSGLWMSRRRAFAVVDLRFVTRRSFKPAADLGVARSQLAHETFHRIVSAFVAVMLDQGLVDGRAIAALDNFSFDERSMDLAIAARRGPRSADRAAQVGGHFGRFCRQQPRLAADPSDRFAAMAGLALYPALGPAQTQQSNDRFSFCHAQFVHDGAFAPRTSEPTAALPVAYFKVPTDLGRFSSARDWPLLSAPRGSRGAISRRQDRTKNRGEVEVADRERIANKNERFSEPHLALHCAPDPLDLRRLVKIANGLSRDGALCFVRAHEL